AGDEVVCGKPDPEAYLLAATALGVDPRHCVVLEDSLPGAQAGLAAGARVIVVPSEMGIAAGPGWRVVDSLTRLDLADLAG
ncbi:MAG: HAD-IA family hydrolase, partial [Mycobacteriales bacterium]